MASMSAMKWLSGTDTPAAKTPGKADGTQVPARPTRNCLHKQLRKTKFCMFHLQGACQFGKDCAFAHSLTEMNGTPDLRKTQLCKAFAEGRCDDPDCNFAHGEPELRSTDMFFKKSLCIWNEKGKCRNDTQCRFAHGLAELRSHQAGHQAMLDAQQADISDVSTKDPGSGVPSPPSSRGGRRRANKKNNNLSDLKDLPGKNGSAANSSNSSRSGSSSGNGSSQQSPSEPMKVQPQSCPPQADSSKQGQFNRITQEPQHRGISDAMIATMMAEANMLSQHQRHWQDTLNNRLGALEEDYLALEAARWHQPSGAAGANALSPDLKADLESLRKGIGFLAAQCNQIQQRMHTMGSKTPQSHTAGLMQQNGMNKPYTSSESLHLLLQMQMQLQAQGLQAGA